MARQFQASPEAPGAYARCPIQDKVSRYRAFPGIVWLLPRDYFLFLLPLEKKQLLGGIGLRLELRWPLWSVANLQGVALEFIDAFHAGYLHHAFGFRKL